MIWKGLVVLLLAGIGLCFLYPDISKLKKDNPAKTSFMKHREQEWLARGKSTKVKQVWVPINRISPYLVKAVIIAEDDKFYKHEGFDYEAIQKAIERDIKQKKFKFGGSTISQQLAKNLYLSSSKNPLRKAMEAFLTWRLEMNLSKKRILELYLNVAEWGEGIFGIEAASLHYYGKPAAELTPEESARLASVLPNPRRFSPVGASKYVEKRSRTILNIMIRRGVISDEYDIREQPQ
ncbi:MAG: monofunctional biosynthetic peptidoglycan transglycosylase [Nitrospirota bacterium]